jgi:hypothetical protein
MSKFKIDRGSDFTFLNPGRARLNYFSYLLFKMQIPPNELFCCTKFPEMIKRAQHVISQMLPKISSIHQMGAKIPHIGYCNNCSGLLFL